MSSGKSTKIILLLCGMAFLAFGILCTPENLLKLEIMENALDSERELIRKGARLEIAGAQALGFLAAAGFFLLIPLWPRIKASARYRVFMERKRDSLRQHQLFRRRFLTPSLAVIAAAIGLIILWIVTADSFLVHEELRLFHREDGIFESVTALLLLCAAVISFRIALRLGRGRPEFYMHLFLGLLFFLMFGEEISWGQRLFGLATPEFLAAVNVQDELNFHNVYGYVFDHLFILGFFTWGVVIPLLDRFSSTFRQIFLAIGLPVPSAGLAVGMLAISLLQSVIVYRFIDPLPTLRLPEARELLSALAFLVLMLEVWILVVRRVPASAQDGPSETGLGAPDSARHS